MSAAGSAAIIVPARNEAERIGACLTAARAAAEAAPVPTEIIVVADGCHDATATIAAAHGVTVLRTDVANASVARALGSACAAPEPDHGVWLAHTDADSLVPETWLVRQLEHAARGYDLVVGTVEVDDWTEWPAGLRERYLHLYESSLRRGIPHVHGANIGISAWAYHRLGGFPAIPIGEDRALVTAAEAAGLAVAYPTDPPVRTSGRRHARVIGGGFHTFLAHLADGLTAATAPTIPGGPHDLNQVV